MEKNAKKYWPENSNEKPLPSCTLTILKSFSKNLSHQNIKLKNRAGKVEEVVKKESKGKSQGSRVLFKPKKSNFYLLWMPKLWKLVFCTGNRRQPSAWLINSVFQSFQKAFFSKIFRTKWVKNIKILFSSNFIVSIFKKMNDCIQKIKCIFCPNFK